MDDDPAVEGEHPAVILRVTERGFLLVLGTSKPRDRTGRLLGVDQIPAAPSQQVFWVEPDSPDGRRMGLTARTYFHPRAQRTVTDPQIRVVAKVSLGLFLELRALLGFNDR